MDRAFRPGQDFEEGSFMLSERGRQDRVILFDVAANFREISISTHKVTGFNSTSELFALVLQQRIVDADS